MGGEKAFDQACTGVVEGSPPRGRGKVGLDGSLSEAVGITPAQAGKSKLALCTPSCPTDHPCAGGEKNKELEGVWLPMGSPPRGRGKEGIVLARGPAEGITPAWAGKSACAASARGGLKDHPRVGGEKPNSRRMSSCRVGSPPHRRGKGFCRAHLHRLPGITPAWAGKSLASQPWSPPLWMMVIRPRP